MQHPRLTKVFQERNTKQSQHLMELRPKDLENASDWYSWSFYWNTVPLHVEKLHTLVKDFDDKLDEKDAVVAKSSLIDCVIEYRERRQALLFCVDFMLNLRNEETQRELSRSVTEWKESFSKLESSWGYLFLDAKQKLKSPIDGTKELKLSQMANGTSADAQGSLCKDVSRRKNRIGQRKLIVKKNHWRGQERQKTKNLAVLWETAYLKWETQSTMWHHYSRKTVRCLTKQSRWTTEQLLAWRSLMEKDWFL